MTNYGENVVSQLTDDPDLRAALIAVLDRATDQNGRVGWQDVSDDISSGQWGRLIEWGVLQDRAGDEFEVRDMDAAVRALSRSQMRHVEHLLEESNGALREAEITSEIGWSPALTEQVVSRMREENRVQTEQTGHKTWVALPSVGASAEGNVSLDESVRVQQLLEQHKSRLKQETIASKLGWSETKASQAISEMAEEGVVDTLRIGRETLVMLPDSDDDETQSASSSNDASTETDVFPGDESEATGTEDEESTNHTKVYTSDGDADEAAIGDADTTPDSTPADADSPSYCGTCGHDLRTQTGTQFCSNCGAEL